MRDKTNINPTSTNWLPKDKSYVASYFNGLGFRSLKEILDMRVFDLMNMNRIDTIRAEEIIICLYQYLNSNTRIDEAMYSGVMSQYFDGTAWRKNHGDLSVITIRDIVFAEDINLKAIQRLYDCIRKKFFRSDEYDRHEYRYYDKSHYDAEVLKKVQGG